MNEKFLKIFFYWFCEERRPPQEMILIKELFPLFFKAPKTNGTTTKKVSENSSKVNKSKTTTKAKSSVKSEAAKARDESRKKMLEEKKRLMKQKQKLI